jgi:hypothetical protein
MNLQALEQQFRAQGSIDALIIGFRMPHGVNFLLRGGALSMYRSFKIKYN